MTIAPILPDEVATVHVALDPIVVIDAATVALELLFRGPIGCGLVSV